MQELVFSRHATLPTEDGWSLLGITVHDSGTAYALMSDSDPHHPGIRPTRYRLFDLDRTGAIFETAPLRTWMSSGRPLGEDFLLTGAWPFGDFQTGCVVGAGGAVRRTIDLGGGIEDVQVADGEIWVSYFDEGVFRRGEPGLACFDEKGSRTFSFRDVAITRPESLVPDIADCYALNVVAPADVWLYYYTEFPLVHLRGRDVDGCWMPTPVRGAKAVAVREPYVVFLGNYESPTASIRYDLRTRSTTEMRCVTGGGDDLNGHAYARGARSYVVESEALWVAEV